MTEMDLFTERRRVDTPHDRVSPDGGTTLQHTKPHLDDPRAQALVRHITSSRN